MQLDLSNLELNVFALQWNWDMKLTASIKLCLCSEPPLTQDVDSQKHVFWCCCDFGSARPLPVSPGFWVPGEGNYTHWHLDFLCNFFVGRTYIFKCDDGLSLFHYLAPFSRHFDMNCLNLNNKPVLKLLTGGVYLVIIKWHWDVIYP